MSKKSALKFRPNPKFERLPPKFVRPEILLHPNIPKPLHGINPRSILGDAWWDEVRQEAYAKNNFCCWACGVHKSDAKFHHWLEAHECYRINYQKGTMTLVEIVALCHCCHNAIHSGRLEMMYDKGEVSLDKYLTILTHGKKVRDNIDDYWYSNNPFIDTSTSSAKSIFAGWEDWVLILDGQQYKGKFENMLEWYRHYNE